MPCFYPEGEPTEWCQRHVQEASHAHGAAKPADHTANA